MNELEAWRWCTKCPGMSIYIGACAITLYIEGQQFSAESIITAVQQAIAAGF